MRDFDASLDDKFSIALIKGALALHTSVSQTFRKTAANFHYEFNIRHIANVFQGLLVARPEQFLEPEKFVFLWVHESERVYGDRLSRAVTWRSTTCWRKRPARKPSPT